MASSPFVEPTAPELRTHLWRLWTQLAQAAELLVDIGASTEVHGPYKVVKTVFGEVRRPVALEQSHLVEARFLNDVSNLAYIYLVLTIRAILILYLNHDDRTAVLNGQTSQLLAHLLLEDGHTLDKVRVALAQTDVFLLQQPPRQTAHLPLSANVWTRTNDDVHAMLLCQTAESSHVVVAGKVKLSLFLLMYVPEDVEADGVHAKRLAHLNAVLPVFAWNTWVVQLSCLNNKWLAIQEECLVANSKVAAFRCSLCIHRKHCQHGNSH